MAGPVVAAAILVLGVAGAGASASGINIVNSCLGEYPIEPSDSG